MLGRFGETTAVFVRSSVWWVRSGDAWVKLRCPKELTATTPVAQLPGFVVGVKHQLFGLLNVHVQISLTMPNLRNHDDFRECITEFQYIHRHSTVYHTQIHGFHESSS